MPTSVRKPLLAIKGLSAGYGKIGVLKDVDVVVYPGEIVAMLGPNGAGKTTLLRAISGLVPWTGQITVAGRSLARTSPRDAVNQGVVHVVEGHRVFTQITVEDNVLLAGYGLPAAQRRLAATCAAADSSAVAIRTANQTERKLDDLRASSTASASSEPDTKTPTKPYPRR